MSYDVTYRGGNITLQAYNLLKHIVLHVSLDSDRKVYKLLQVCDRYDLIEEKKILCKIRGMYWKQKRNGQRQALCWFLKGGDGSVTQLANSIFEKALRTGSLTDLDTAVENQEDVTYEDIDTANSHLSFVSLYREFRLLLKDVMILQQVSYAILTTATLYCNTCDSISLYYNYLRLIEATICVFIYYIYACYVL